MLFRSDLFLLEFLEVHVQTLLLHLHPSVLLLGIGLVSSGSCDLVVETSDESSHDFKRCVDIVVDIRVGRVEADDQQIVNSFVV